MSVTTTTRALPYPTFRTVSVRQGETRHRSPLCWHLWTNDRITSRRWLGTTLQVDDDQLAAWPVCEDCASAADLTEAEFTQAWYDREFAAILG